VVPVRDNKLALMKAPSIEWLKILYEDITDFYLPLVDILGLNGSQQWYLRGMRYPMLKKALHPFYGVYFPVRFEHLELFNAWLEQDKEERDFCYDIGAGAGVLTFIMLKHGVRAVYATDLNPNAIESMSQDLKLQELSDRVELSKTDLFGAQQKKSSLIVFNPPWLPGEVFSLNDLGINYAGDLFSRFFSEAHKRLAPEGRLVMLFSNFAQLAKVRRNNPIEVELETENRFQLLNYEEVKVMAPSSKNRRSWLSELRKKERVQLWELGLK